MEFDENNIVEKPIILPTREHAALIMFVGKWAISGENLALNPNEENTTVQGVETYEWLPGGFFLLYKWDRHFDSESHIGLGVICHNDANAFTINNYDNLGYQRTYKIEHQGNTWNYTGHTKRAVIQFNSNGNSFTEKWEILDQAKNWKPLCSLTAERISS